MLLQRVEIIKGDIVITSRATARMLSRQAKGDLWLVSPVLCSL